MGSSLVHATRLSTSELTGKQRTRLDKRTSVRARFRTSGLRKAYFWELSGEIVPYKRLTSLTYPQHISPRRLPACDAGSPDKDAPGHLYQGIEFLKQPVSYISWLTRSFDMPQQSKKERDEGFLGIGREQRQLRNDVGADCTRAGDLRRITLCKYMDSRGKPTVLRACLSGVQKW